MARILLYVHVIALVWHQGTSSQLDLPQLCIDEDIDIPTSDAQYAEQLQLSELGETITYLQGLLDSGCSDILGRFLCLAHLPRPNVIKNKLAQDGAPHQYLLPCSGVCRDIWRSCRSTASQLGLRRPAVFDCSKRYLHEDNSDCLTADHLYPPVDTPLLNSVTRFRNNSASLEFHPQSTYRISKFGVLIRFNDTTGLKSNMCRLQNSNPDYTMNTCIEAFDRPDSYILELFLVNGFGEGPKMRYVLKAVEDDVSAEDSTSVMGTSIYKASYGSYWSCSDVDVKLCPNHTRAALPNPVWPNHPYTRTTEHVESILTAFSQLFVDGCLNWFLCASYLPTCTEEGVIIPPCRETCYRAHTCPPIAQFFQGALPMPDCQNLPWRSSGKCVSEPGVSAEPEVVTPEGQCEDIAIPMCRSDIPYTKTSMPNYLNMTTQYEARLHLQSFYSLVNTDCSPYLRTFLCAVSVPRCFDDGSSPTKRVPCRELCEEARSGCRGLMTEFGISWPQNLECEKLPGRETGACYNGADDEKSEDVPTLAPAVAARRYELKDLGLPSLFRGWVDVQGQGAANDYCRVVTITNRQGATPFLSCALAGMQGAGEYNYNSTGAWFDAGHMDTWYMRDVNQDGRDDYCRCVGCVPETYTSCLLADDGGFLGAVLDFQPPQGGCHYIRVNPFFGTP
ncbi:uncharacterized protein LOC117295853 isoform X1 [Asterias rubens]|uniref:uncharacterized protein LOC117295853 isoform X1 n=1 Tax=Asterias rubens TaxID=7604 RepID=UPI0014556C22|nr:uncharacterized protein LOC117295853 isoform X1 [Asterias rubens]